LRGWLFLLCLNGHVVEFGLEYLKPVICYWRMEFFKKAKHEGNIYAKVVVVSANGEKGKSAGASCFSNIMIVRPIPRSLHLADNTTDTIHCPGSILCKLQR
jgi:hypothetical protein